MKNQISAVIIQYILSGILGFAFAIGSFIFEIERWSITKQTIAHSILLVVVMFPIAYSLYWMKHTLAGVLSYTIVFAAIYVSVWFTQIMFYRNRIKKINKKLNAN